MTAGQYDITIEQGATFERTLTWNDQNGSPINLTGYTARMHVRRTHYDNGTPLLTLTTENGGITLGGAAGTIALTVSATATSAVTAASGVYDLELVSAGGRVTRLLEGSVDFTPEVTR